MEKREMNIPRQWEKRVLGKNSPYYAKYKSLYPGGGSREKLSKLKLERTIRNLSANAKISLLQPELAKAKKEVSERKELQSLLGPALGDDMDSLPDDPWFGKSPEEKHADVIQEEHGQLENIDSSILPGLNPKDDFTGQWETGFVGEREGEKEGALAFIGGDISEQKFLKPDDLGFADDALGFNKPTWGKDWEGEEESTLEGSGLAAKILRGRAGQGEKFDLDPQDKIDIETEPSTWDSLKGLFASDEDSAPATKSKGLSPMQKYGAKLITDIFGEKEGTPQQSIGASPLTPGRTFDMSYLKSRPKKERYRNRGLLGGA